MTAATLTGRHLANGIHRRRDEIEAWLSIGATPRRALRDIARYAIVETLVPVLDTTRTVGLVTLPGAFAYALRRPGLAALTAHIPPLLGLSGG
jgi:putative ABC transport system permease protein